MQQGTSAVHVSGEVVYPSGYSHGQGGFVETPVSESVPPNLQVHHPHSQVFAHPSWAHQESSNVSQQQICLFTSYFPRAMNASSQLKPAGGNCVKHPKAHQQQQSTFKHDKHQPVVRPLAQKSSTTQLTQQQTDISQPHFSKKPFNASPSVTTVLQPLRHKFSGCVNNIQSRMQNALVNRSPVNQATFTSSVSQQHQPQDAPKRNAVYVSKKGSHYLENDIREGSHNGKLTSQNPAKVQKLVCSENETNSCSGESDALKPVNGSRETLCKVNSRPVIFTATFVKSRMPADTSTNELRASNFHQVQASTDFSTSHPSGIIISRNQSTIPVTQQDTSTMGGVLSASLNIENTIVNKQNPKTVLPQSPDQLVDAGKSVPEKQSLPVEPHHGNARTSVTEMQSSLIEPQQERTVPEHQSQPLFPQPHEGTCTLPYPEENDSQDIYLELESELRRILGEDNPPHPLCPPPRNEQPQLSDTDGCSTISGMKRKIHSHTSEEEVSFKGSGKSSPFQQSNMDLTASLGKSNPSQQSGMDVTTSSGKSSPSHQSNMDVTASSGEVSRSQQSNMEGSMGSIIASQFKQSNKDVFIGSGEPSNSQPLSTGLEVLGKTEHLSNLKSGKSVHPIPVGEVSCKPTCASGQDRRHTEGVQQCCDRVSSTHDCQPGAEENFSVSLQPVPDAMVGSNLTPPATPPICGPTERKEHISLQLLYPHSSLSKLGSYKIIKSSGNNTASSPRYKAVWQGTQSSSGLHHFAEESSDSGTSKSKEMRPASYSAMFSTRTKGSKSSSCSTPLKRNCLNFEGAVLPVGNLETEITCYICDRAVCVDDLMFHLYFGSVACEYCDTTLYKCDEIKELMFSSAVCETRGTEQGHVFSVWQMDPTDILSLHIKRDLALEKFYSNAKTAVEDKDVVAKMREYLKKLSQLDVPPWSLAIEKCCEAINITLAPVLDCSFEEEKPRLIMDSIICNEEVVQGHTSMAKEICSPPRYPRGKSSLPRKSNRFKNPDFVDIPLDGRYLIVYCLEQEPPEECPECYTPMCPTRVTVNTETFMGTYQCPTCFLMIFLVVEPQDSLSVKFGPPPLSVSKNGVIYREIFHS